MAQLTIEDEHREFAQTLVGVWEQRTNARLSEYSRMLLYLAAEAWMKESRFTLPSANTDDFKRELAEWIVATATREAHVEECREMERPVPLHTLMFALSQVGRGIGWLFNKGI
jgi:hypothetical protein